MAIIIKSDGKSVWGVVPGTGDTFAAGKLVSMSRSPKRQQEKLLDSTGQTVGLALYDETTELKLEVIWSTAFTEPAIGDDVVVDGVTGTALDVEVKWEQKGWKKLSISATNFPNLESESLGAQNLSAKKPVSAKPETK